jgi:hypothetical protein
MNRTGGLLFFLVAGLAMAQGLRDANVPPGAALGGPSPKPYVMDPLPQKEIDAVQAKARAAGGSKAVGVHRDVPAKALDSGKWVKLSDGRMLWRWSVRSPGAVAVRLEFSGVQLLAGSELWVYEPGAAAGQAGRFPAKGQASEGTFWAQTVFRDTVMVEYLPRDGKKANVLPFRVVKLSHQFTDMF